MPKRYSVGSFILGNFILGNFTLGNFILGTVVLGGFMSAAAEAATPCVRDAIQTSLENIFEPLTNKQNWDHYVESHASEFPTPQPGQISRVEVEPVDVQVDGHPVTVGLAYRQVWIHADLERVKKILLSPSIFQDLYGLNAEASVLDAPLRARIFKKVPVLADQDYTLDYDAQKQGNSWIIRAKLVDDKNQFAARDNLLILEPIQNGTLFRELSGAYIRSGFLRMLGPQVRSITKSELTKLSESVRCLAEKDPTSQDLKHENAKLC